MDEQETGKQDSAKQEASYDYHRYKQLLAEAVDETKRLELIEIIIREKARDRLEAQRIADRVAMTAMTVARVLGPGGRRDNIWKSDHFSEASIASEPTSPISAQARRPY
ncbi:hypothetical protein LMTR3_16430 [Bradyrhizobium sp. LMTR 3]|nr:hypothetical protein LMTR3_16430 [Bradyrhizobium sp. LMTR 3]